jgi:hypothetical protein
VEADSGIYSEPGIRTEYVWHLGVKLKMANEIWFFIQNQDWIGISRKMRGFV